MRVDTESSPDKRRKWMVFLGAALVPLASWLVIGRLAARWDLPFPIWLIPFLVFVPGFVVFVVHYWRSKDLGIYAALLVTGFLFGYIVTGLSVFLLILYLLRGLGD